MRGLFRCAVLLGLALVLPVRAAADEAKAAPGELTLAVAASLRTAMPELIGKFVASEPGPGLVASYGGSGALQKQVEGGAPIDAVVFAAPEPVDALIQGGHAERETRCVVGTNQLALIAPKGAKPLIFATLDQLPAGEKIAIGDPASVPVGIYARAGLQKLGVWEKIQGRLVTAPDVAAVLAYARRGEVGAAIVYRTDAQGVADVDMLELAKGDWAPRPEIVAAAASGSKAGGRAARFVAFLCSPAAGAILRAHAFEPAAGS